MEDIYTIRTDFPTPEEIAPKVLSGTTVWWNYTANREATRPFSTPSKSRYHAPRPVEAWTSGRALTSGHVSPVVQSARLILQKYDNLTRNKKLSRVSLDLASDVERKIDFIKCEPRRNYLKAGNQNEKGHTCFKNGNGEATLPWSLQSRSLSNFDDQSAFVRNRSQHLLVKDDRQIPIVQFAEEEKERINGSSEGVFLTEVRNDWTGFRKKPAKVSFNVAVDNAFSKHVRNWSPKVYNSKIHHFMETIQE